MTAYFVVNYDVSDVEQYAKYNPGSNHITAATVAKHGGEIIVATNKGVSLAGSAAQMRVIIQFPSKEDAQAWDDDPEYAQAKAIRLASTTNIDAYIVDKLAIPE
ncbi:DUF1330 domain-containing protein [Marinomonas arenicola]|uniref:DUF1330 domain-containing protein n=1 Tax=Marinomonas arenicola TaxID=569601 RepID=A0ABU9G9I6_9GAMM